MDKLVAAIFLLIEEVQGLRNDLAEISSHGTFGFKDIVESVDLIRGQEGYDLTNVFHAIGGTLGYNLTDLHKAISDAADQITGEAGYSLTDIHGSLQDIRGPIGSDIGDVVDAIRDMAT